MRLECQERVANDFFNFNLTLLRRIFRCATALLMLCSTIMSSEPLPRLQEVGNAYPAYIIVVIALFPSFIPVNPVHVVSVVHV
jgi:hypothetical protein